MASKKQEKKIAARQKYGKFILVTEKEEALPPNTVIVIMETEDKKADPGWFQFNKLCHAECDESWITTSS